MNETKAGQLWPIMKQFSEGATVDQWMPNGDPGDPCLGVWVRVKDPSFDPRFKWRVSPETQYFLLDIDRSGMVVRAVPFSEEALRLPVLYGNTRLKVRATGVEVQDAWKGFSVEKLQHDPNLNTV